MPREFTAEERRRIGAIVAALVERATSQEALAASLGVSQTMISRASRGMELFPKLTRRLAEAFGCTLAELPSIDPRTRPFHPSPVPTTPLISPPGRIPKNLAIALAYHASEERWSAAALAVVESGALASLTDVAPPEWTERLDGIDAEIKATIARRK